MPYSLNNPSLQYVVSLALFACGVTSFVLFITQGKAQPVGNIKLDTELGPELRGEGSDPSEVTKSEDVVDGYPVDEEEYWQQVRPSSSTVWMSSFDLHLTEPSQQDFSSLYVGHRRCGTSLSSGMDPSSG